MSEVVESDMLQASSLHYPHKVMAQYTSERDHYHSRGRRRGTQKASTEIRNVIPGSPHCASESTFLIIKSLSVRELTD